MTAQEAILAIMGIVVAVGVLVYVKHESAPAKTQELVKTCKAPLFRKPTEYVTRDQDGKLWYTHNDVHVPVADGTNLNTICSLG